MKRIFYLYRDMTQMLGQYRAYVKPELFCDALHFASRGLFDHYYGNTEEYRPGKPLPRVAYQLTTAVSDALHPFRREVVYGRDGAKLEAGEIEVGPDDATAKYLLLGDNGRFALPEGWVHPTSWTVPGAIEAVQVLDDNEVANMLNSLICPPTLLEPMLEIVPGGMQMHPKEVEEFRVQYLGFPTRPVYFVDYPEEGVDGEPVYNDEKSVDVEWPASRDNQLLTRLLQYPALGLRDQVVQQVTQSLTDRGA